MAKQQKKITMNFEQWPLPSPTHPPTAHQKSDSFRFYNILMVLMNKFIHLTLSSGQLRQVMQYKWLYLRHPLVTVCCACIVCTEQFCPFK